MAYDLIDPDFLSDPDPTLARMRSEGPLARAKIPLVGEVWITTTDAAARRVLKSPDLFVRNRGQWGGKPLERQFWWMPPFLRPVILNLLGFDGPPHDRLRGLVDAAFARTKVEAMRPDLERIADSLLDGLDAGEAIDLRARYAQPLPLIAICALLGIPETDRAKVTRWIAPISSVAGFRGFAKAIPGLWLLLRHFRKEYRRLKANPGTGLFSDLVHIDVDGDRMTEDEVVSMVTTLFIAGHETTVHLITNGLVAILRDRAIWPEEPAHLPLFVEEIVRFSSPVTLTNLHFVREDTDVLGAPLKKDERVMAFLLAANHDPDRHADPAALIPDRRPNAHLGFGHGPHVCLGMQLARAEAQIALARFMQLYPEAKLADPEAPTEWIRRTGARGPAHLQVRLIPRR